MLSALLFFPHFLSPCNPITPIIGHNSQFKIPLHNIYEPNQQLRSYKLMFFMAKQILILSMTQQYLRSKTLIHFTDICRRRLCDVDLMKIHTQVLKYITKMLVIFDSGNNHSMFHFQKLD